MESVVGNSVIIEGSSLAFNRDEFFAEKIILKDCACWSYEEGCFFSKPKYVRRASQSFRRFECISYCIYYRRTCF